MSYDRACLESLKLKNNINLRLPSDKISKDRNSVKNQFKPNLKYYNNNTNKNKIYSNYKKSNNKQKKSNPIIDKTNITQVPKNNNNSRTKSNKKEKEKEKEKLNIIYAPTITNTTKDSTINSIKSKTDKKQEPFFYEPTSKDTLNSPESANENNKKIKGPENDDIKFLYNIFYNYNISKESEKNLSGVNKKNNINFNELRNYLIANEKNFKKEGNILLYQSSRASGLVLDFYFIKKLENLIARFSFIIFIFIQSNKLDEARNIFLLMLRENRIYLDYIEKKLTEYYSTTNRKINIAKDYPRMTYELIRIYSFIIKYSQFFNMMNYRNIFLGRYFELLFFIYNFFNLKGNTRMFNIETKNQLIYWFSFALHNLSYYSTSNYFPMKISIDLSNYIIHLYQGFEENHLTDSEKSLIIKTYYNLGLFYYLDGQKDNALMNLDKAKERITNIEETDIVDTSFCHMKLKKKDSINILVAKTKKVENNLFNNSIITEENPLSKRLSTNYSITENSKINNLNNNDDEAQGKDNEKNKKKSNVIEQICKGFSKKKNDLDDIKLLINYGVRNGLITEINKQENETKHKYRKIFRGSHINLSTTFRVKDFLIPYYFNNPLLRKVELLMGEIELDKNNYNSAYEHILRAFYILISLKINRTSGNQKEFSNEQKIIDKYLTLIEKYKDEEEKNNEREKDEIRDNNINSLNNSNMDSFQENFKDEFNDVIMEKYNLNDDESEENNEEENMEILVCGEKILDFKALKEIEKFFIFLNSLSLFQIKILNETQPDNVKRNDLPILFPSQFKDCLSNIQRIELDNLQTMALSRFIVLKDPNKWIMPNNLNIDIIKQNEYKDYEKLLNKKEQIEEKKNTIPIKETREYKYYQKILLSEKSNKEIKEFLNTNFDLIITILKQTNEEEIQNIINFPYIIIESVKKYKKKRKKKLLKMKKQGYNITKYENRRFNYLLLNNNYDYDNDYDNCNPNRHFGRLRTFSSSYKSNSSRFRSKNLKFNNNLPNKAIRGNETFCERNRNRIKSLYNKNGPNLKQLEKEEINDNKDYNDSYQDYSISLENSLDNKK